MNTPSILLFVLLNSSLVVAAESDDRRIGQPVPEFTLEDSAGKTYSLSDFKEKPLVVLAFLGTECPLAKLYAANLERLATQYRARGVAVIAINSNAQDSFEDVADFKIDPHRSAAERNVAGEDGIANVEDVLAGKDRAAAEELGVVGVVDEAASFDDRGLGIVVIASFKAHAERKHERRKR